MKARVWSELKWFAGWFVVPMLALIGLDAAFSTSPLPFWKRLLTLEDTCAYGYCLILPALLFAIVLGVRILVGVLRPLRGKRTNGY